MIFKLAISNEAAKALARLDRRAKQRMAQRFEELRQDPFNARISAPLTHKDGLRKSRIGGWRIIYTLDRDELNVLILTVARRGQVYQRI